MKFIIAGGIGSLEDIINLKKIENMGISGDNNRKSFIRRKKLKLI